MNYIRFFILAALMSVCILNASAQQQSIEVTQLQNDSLQRKVMVDSLGVSDSAVTKLYAIRDAYFTAIQNMRSANRLEDAKMKEEIETIRRQTNDSIKVLLGNDAYEKYLTMIRSRMQRRSEKNKQPLTIDNN